jgi:hypothetical protein
MKPCPFCKSVELISYYEVEGDYAYVFCQICGAQGPTAKSKEMAVKKWDGLLLNVKTIEKFNQIVREDAVGGVSSPMATLNNTPGMGNVVPGSTLTYGIGSGDKFGNSNFKMFTQSSLTRKKKKRIKEGGFVNPYDKVGNAMLKKMKVDTPFKKGPDGTVKSTKKYKIKPLDEYMKNTYDEFGNKELMEDLYITLLYRIPDDIIKYEEGKETYEKYAEKYLDKVEPLSGTTKKYPILFKVYFKDGTIIIAHKISRWRGDWLFELDGKKYNKWEMGEIFKDKYLTKFEYLEHELKVHDWFYEMSDDHSIWTAGVRHDKLLSELSKELKEEGYEKEVEELWDKYSPKN